MSSPPDSPSSPSWRATNGIPQGAEGVVIVNETFVKRATSATEAGRIDPVSVLRYE